MLSQMAGMSPFACGKRRHPMPAKPAWGVTRDTGKLRYYQHTGYSNTRSGGSKSGESPVEVARVKDAQGGRRPVPKSLGTAAKRSLEQPDPTKEGHAQSIFILRTKLYL